MFDTPSLLTRDEAAANMVELYSTFDEPESNIPSCVAVAPADMPQPDRDLLAHHSHMTVTLENFIGAPVNVTVLTSRRNGQRYARKILLTNSKTGEVVMFGIMRFNFDHCSDEVRDKIVEEKTPLGRILIQHGVMRRVTCHAMLRIKPNSDLRECFKIPSSEPVYGRFATIFCDNEPAVDLLEVTAPKMKGSNGAAS